MGKPQRAAIVAALVCASLLTVRAQQPELDTSLPALLVRLGQYVDQYELDIAAVVSEEHYQQEVVTVNGMFGDKRLLRSDLLLSRAGDLGWVAFRDVFEVDGKEVRDRSDRLLDLFLTPTADSRDQLGRIISESARFNIGWVVRNINVPTMVLQFAKPAQQLRSEFRRGGIIRVSGAAAREIRFEENTAPRIIHTPDGAAARGRFWIDEATGRVVKTELVLATRATTATITVGYELQPQLKLWVPILMEERYSTPRQPVIAGRASYKNFRRFQVLVEQIIK